MNFRVPSLVQIPILMISYVPKNSLYIKHTCTISFFHLVPCYRRCSQMSVAPENEKVIKLNQDDDDEEGWVDTHHGIGNHLFIE